MREKVNKLMALDAKAKKERESAERKAEEAREQAKKEGKDPEKARALHSVDFRHTQLQISITFQPNDMEQISTITLFRHHMLPTHALTSMDS